MASLQPTAYEQYMLELVNRARANPLAEVALNPAIADLNEDLSPGTISSSAKQPLTFNLDLIESARGHSQWMLDVDAFSHTGINGTQPKDRMIAAGYVFTGSWANGENISWQGSTGNLDLAQSIGIQHNNLFDSAGHRVNLMNGNYKEIGVGAITGQFTSNSQTFNALMVTQNFAKSGSSTFLTGVIYTDAVLNDDFYTVGEGVTGVSIKAIRQSDQQTFSTTNFSSGGYSLALTPGTYNVSFSGGGLNQTVSTTLAIGSDNYKYDVATDKLAPPLAKITADQSFDLVWRNPNTGASEAWSVAAGAKVSNSAFILTLADPNWQIGGVGDLDSDGRRDDLVWRHTADGQNSMWFNQTTTSGITTQGGGWLPSVSGQSWEIQGVGDFDRDSFQDDLIWFNVQSQDMVVWYLNKGQISGGDWIKVAGMGNGWQIGGIGNFDGKSSVDDILWRNTMTGDNVIWFMNGVSPQSSAFLSKVTDQKWQVEGVADLDNDGKTDDLVWHHQGSGMTNLWYMEGSNLIGGVTDLQPCQPLGCQVVA